MSANNWGPKPSHSQPCPQCSRVTSTTPTNRRRQRNVQKTQQPITSFAHFSPTTGPSQSLCSSQTAMKAATGLAQAAVNFSRQPRSTMSPHSLTNHSLRDERRKRNRKNAKSTSGMVASTKKRGELAVYDCLKKTLWRWARKGALNLKEWRAGDYMQSIEPEIWCHFTHGTWWLWDGVAARNLPTAVAQRAFQVRKQREEGVRCLCTESPRCSQTEKPLPAEETTHEAFKHSTNFPSLPHLQLQTWIYLTRHNTEINTKGIFGGYIPCVLYDVHTWKPILKKGLFARSVNASYEP